MSLESSAKKFEGGENPEAMARVLIDKEQAAAEHLSGTSKKAMRAAAFITSATDKQRNLEQTFSQELNTPTEEENPAQHSDDETLSGSPEDRN